MSSISGVWNQIREMARGEGIPNKPRAILREYLQVKALDYLYGQKGAEKLSFIGGTSLRLLANIPRFSEDLDFDNLGIGDIEVTKLVRNVAKRFEGENIELELFEKITEGKTYFELRFPNLLKELEISTNPREKLMIKVDYGRQYHGQKTRNVLVKRFGVVQSVVTNELGQVLVEKLVAYGARHTLQPRDMYDVVWLWGQGAKLDQEFVRANKLLDVVKIAKARLKKEGVKEIMKRKLAPFLFVPGEEKKLDLFPQVLEELDQ